MTAAALLLGVCAVEQAAAAGTTRAGELPVAHKAPDQIASASAVLDAPGPVATSPTNQLDPKQAFANIQAAGQTVDSSVGQSAVDAAKQLASTTASVPANPSQSAPTPDSGSAQAKQLAPSESYTPFSHKTTDANGQTHVDEYADPAFKQVDGKWVPLSGDILPTISKQAGAPAATAPGMVKPVEFGASASSMLQFDLGGGPVTVKPTGLRITAPSVTAGDVTYHDVVPNVDLHYATDTSRVKEAFTIRSPLAQSAFTFHLSDPTAQLGELKQLGDGTFLFLGTDTAGTALALPAAVAFAASANPDVKPLPDPNSASLVVTKAGDGYDIVVSVNPLWAIDKQYPITLDPTYWFWPIAGGSPGPVIEGFAYSCTNGCNSPLYTSGSMYTGTYDDPSLGGVLAREYLMYVLKGGGAYIPDRAQITSASYNAYYEACIGYAISQNPYSDLCSINGDNYLMRLDRMSAPWYYGTPFSTLANNAVASGIPDVATGSPRNKWVSWDVTSLLQHWVNFNLGDWLPNYGLQMRLYYDGTPNYGGPVSNSSTYIPQTGDSGGANSRPLFAINYTETTPSPVTGLTATPVINTNGNPTTQANLSWTIPTTGTEPNSYYIQAVQTDTGVNLGQNIVPEGSCGDVNVACSGTRSYTWSGLTPGKTYTFYVWAANQTPAFSTAATASATMWIPPSLTLTPTGGGTSNVGDQKTWTLGVANLNDRPFSAIGAIAIPQGLTQVPGTVRINGNPCALYPNITNGLPDNKCWSDLVGNGLWVGIPAIAPGATTNVAFDAITTTAALSPCDQRTFAIWVPTYVGTATSATFNANPATICNGGLGYENWWNFVNRPIGPQGQASVNVANGNLVVQQIDSTPIQGHGQLGSVLRRTYNSQAPTSIAPFGTSLGQGWNLNISTAGDLVTGGVTGDGLLVPQDLTQPVATAITNGRLPGTAVTLIDRDGTRHVFTPNTTGVSTPVAAGASLTTLVTDLTAKISGGTLQVGDITSLISGIQTAGAGLTGSLSLCVSTSYNAPPGVHESLWRYVVVQASGASACNLDATLATPTVVAGYSVMRPDRVRENFDILGRLLSMFDRSGNELRYTYDAQLRLIAVWEPAACNNDVNSSRCRKIAFNYGTGSSDHIDVTDPAGRVTTYQRASTSPSANLTSVITRDSLGGTQLERWDYRYKGDANTSSCVAPTGALCEVISPQAQATGQPGTRFDYTTSTIPQVAKITERVGGTANTSFDYRSANSYTDVVRDGHAVRYQQIDTTGRVGQVIEGTLSGPGGTITALRQTNYTWDTAGATCRPRDNKVDNDLCSVTKLALAAPANFGNPAGWTMTPDQVSSMTYTPLGQPLSEAQAIGGQNLTSTYGYQTTYTTPDNTTSTYTDTPTGLGAVAASPAGAPPSYLYATSDRRFMLPARGNAPAAVVANFLTTYAVDANAAIPPGRMDAAHGASPVCGSGNSGLVCTETAPQAHITSFTYDVKGQRASSRTPAANAGFNDGCATPPAGVPICSTTYSYYPDTDTDLSVGVSAGGWMRAAVDPYGKFVAFTYDRAGDAVRTWDRDATAGHLVTDYGTGATNPGTPAETLYRDPAAADPLARPWRYERQQSDQNANKTTWTVDLDGNRTTLRPPRGNAVGANTYDIFQSFDGNDRQTSVLAPVENPDHQPGTADDKPTTTSYDGNGDKTVVTDANGHQTVTVYDAVSRPTAMLFTRGAWDSQTAPATCVNSTGNPNKAPIADNKTLCTATTTYDGQDHKIRVVDAAAGTGYVAYDAVGRTTQQYVQRTPAPSPTYTTGAWHYDTAGNALDSCPPRQAAEEGACTATAHFAAHTTYDELNRPLVVTAYRETVDSSGTKVAGSWVPLTTVTAYPLAQNSLQVTDPNGHQTSVVSDLLDRHTTTTVPRDTAASVSDTTKTTYSASGDVNSVDIRQTNAPGPTELLAYRYDPGHRLLDTVDAATAATAAANSDSYKAVEGTAPANLRTRHAYDNDGNIVATWDARAFTSSVTTPDNRFLTRVDYDADGRPIAKWQPFYDTTNHTAINPDIELQECPATSGGYQPQPATGANFPTGVGVCVTRVEHDPVGNITKVTNPTATNPSNAARYNTYTYTDDNLAALLEMPNPAPVGGSEPARVQTTYRYDATGRPTRTTGPAQPNGQWSTQTSYSPDGLTTATQSPAGVDPVTQAEQRTTVAYNANGQPTNATGYANTPGRQGTGQPSTIQNTSYYADGKTYEVAVPVTGVNVGTIATHYGYDPNGNPTTVWSPSAVAHAANNPTGMATVNMFTDDNLLKATVDPISAPDTRRATTYAYDPAGRKLSQTVNEITGTNPYDNTKITRAGGTQSITYTPNGWASTETARDGIQIQHAYAANGLETGTTQYDAGHTVQSTITNDYLLNGLLRDSSTTVTGGTPAYSTKYNGFKYTADGLPYAQITGNDSTFTTADQVETFAYNDARTLSGVTSVGFGRSNDHWALTDDRLGRPTTMVDPNGRQTDYAYSLPGNLLAKTFRSAGPASAALDTWTYDYDGQNRVTGRHRNQPNAQYPPGIAVASNDTYHYDEAARLDTVNAASIGYDPDGNRSTYNSKTWAYRADNSISAQGALAYSYNPEGDLTNDGCRTYSYDGFDRLTATTAVACGAMGNATHSYDALNRQAQTTTTGAPSETRQVHYVGTSTTRWTEDSSDPTKTGHYTLSPDGQTLGVTDTATAPNFNITESDGQGNIVLATTPSGIACAVDLDPWGQPRNNNQSANPANPCVNGVLGTASTPNTTWYAGNRRDANTGTYQDGARTYSPATANWLTPDTNRAGNAAKNLSIGADPFTQNRYSYVNGDPVNLTDPTGHSACDDTARSWRGCSAHDRARYDQAATRPSAAAATGAAGGNSTTGSTSCSGDSHMGEVTIDSETALSGGRNSACIPNDHPPGWGPLMIFLAAAAAAATVACVLAEPCGVTAATALATVDAAAGNTATDLADDASPVLAETPTVADAGADATATALTDTETAATAGETAAADAAPAAADASTTGSSAAAEAGPLAEIGPAGNPGAFPELNSSTSSLQHTFSQHAGNFGFNGNWNSATGELFEESLTSHVNAADTLRFPGTYRGDPVIFNVDPATGLNVLQSPSGGLISGWQLTPQQLWNVLTRGSL